MPDRPELSGPIVSDTPHFTWEEVRCRHCGKLPDNIQSVINAARMMEQIRLILGSNPLHVNSWYRCPIHNSNVGGASNSQHLYGRAVDFSHKFLTPREIARRLKNKKYLGEGKLIGGLGSYPGFVHTDNRPEDRGAYWRV